MKNALKIIACSLAGVFLSGFSVFAQDAFNIGESISSFDAAYEIYSNGNVSVVEKITYNFGINQRHGIFRNIPIKYKTGNGIRRMNIVNVDVTNENGDPYKFSKSTDGNDLVIKIGDPDLLIEGVHEYNIRYTVKNSINYFDNHDEFYWNVTGNGWNVPIYGATAVVTFPESNKFNFTGTDCFIGFIGSTEKCQINQIDDAAKKSTVRFANHAYFQPGQGLTIVAGFPKGEVYQPSKLEQILIFLSDNPKLVFSIVFPIILFIFLFFKWLKNGRDPRGRATIIPEYEPPYGLSPSQVGAILDGHVETAEITSEIIALAIKGYLKINRIEKNGIFGSADYELVKLKEPDQEINDIQSKLLKYLFLDEKSTIELTAEDIKKAKMAKLDLSWLKAQKMLLNEDTNVVTKNSIKISELKYQFAPRMTKLKSAVYDQMANLGYFKASPEKTRNKYILGGVICAGISFYLGGWLILAGVLSCIVFLIFAWIMPARTPQGVQLMQEALGFKMYLSVAEKDRIKFHNAPEKNPQLFEKFLPYAMVMKVEKQWAEQFKDIAMEAPNWYSGSTGQFNSVVFANQMRSFGDTSKSSMAAAASGGSGLGGGGSSGGGGGGGGGGGW